MEIVNMFLVTSYNGANSLFRKYFLNFLKSKSRIVQWGKYSFIANILINIIVFDSSIVTMPSELSSLFCYQW